MGSRTVMFINFKAKSLSVVGYGRFEAPTGRLAMKVSQITMHFKWSLLKRSYAMPSCDDEIPTGRRAIAGSSQTGSMVFSNPAKGQD